MLALKAEGAAIWVRSEIRSAKLAYQVMPPQLWPGETQALRGRSWMELVLDTAQAWHPAACAICRRPLLEPSNLTHCLWIVCPWLLEARLPEFLEVLKSPGASAEVQTGYVRFLETIGELIANQERANQLRDARDRLQESQRFDQFSETIHGSVDLRRDGIRHVANEGRQFLGCDRLSVFVKRGRGLRLLAMSGVDAFQLRAKFWAWPSSCAKAVAAMHETLWHPERAQRPTSASGNARYERLSR